MLSDDTISVLDEVREDAEDLRLHGDDSASAAKLEHVGIEVECSERVDQTAALTEGDPHYACWMLTRLIADVV